MEIFKNKKVLVTGHTGFKGSWLVTWLHHLGADIYGLSDKIVTEPSNFNASQLQDIVKTFWVNILDQNLVKETIKKIEPDFIFHLAAQALVGQSYIDPVNTLQVNSIGTANILDSVREIPKRITIVMITSDKVYDNVEWKWGYRENDLLGGKDPYSASKAMAELAIKSYIHSFFSDSSKRIAITRAGNVIGGGDWAKDRIVPDCVMAWSRSQPVFIRNPKSTRPWQHVLEPLVGYLLLAAKLHSSEDYHSQAYNFGPNAINNFTVMDLIREMSTLWNGSEWVDVSDKEKSFSEAQLLKLNCDKAFSDLSWQPVLNFKETADYTVEWYKEFYESERSMLSFSISQIESYIKLAKKRRINWANEF